jgi:hypothetical protein
MPSTNAIPPAQARASSPAALSPSQPDNAAAHASGASTKLNTAKADRSGSGVGRTRFSAINIPGPTTTKSSPTTSRTSCCMPHDFPSLCDSAAPNAPATLQKARSATIDHRAASPALLELRDMCSLVIHRSCRGDDCLPQTWHCQTLPNAVAGRPAATWRADAESHAEGTPGGPPPGPRVTPPGSPPGAHATPPAGQPPRPVGPSPGPPPWPQPESPPR